jgi:hypothetical protein
MWISRTLQGKFMEAVFSVRSVPRLYSVEKPYSRSRFSLVPERMLSWYPNSTLHCMLSCSPPNINFSKFRHNIALPMLDYNSPHYTHSNIFKIQNWTNPEYKPCLYQKD